MIKKYYLLSPGPTPIPADVLSSAAEPIIHHRTPEFSAIFMEVSAGLKYVFQTEQDVFVLTSSGTGAMQAAVVNTLSAGDKVISLNGGKFIAADLTVSASCTRVNVQDGHLESVSVGLKQKASADDLIATWEEFNPLGGQEFPSAPSPPIIYRREDDRPQPRRDRGEGNGMACVVGRLRECSILDYKFFVLSHNTIRGAAGAAILNAEYLYKKGLL